MQDEDETFKRLLKPSWNELKEMKPFAASNEFFEARGWTWEEFKTEWVIRIKRQQEYNAQKLKNG
jgi:hypothetical protein